MALLNSEQRIKYSCHHLMPRMNCFEQVSSAKVSEECLASGSTAKPTCFLPFTFCSLLKWNEREINTEIFILTIFIFKGN